MFVNGWVATHPSVAAVDQSAGGLKMSMLLSGPSRERGISSESRAKKTCESPGVMVSWF